MVADGKLFTSVAIQLHWGSAVAGDNLNWHVDAPNSLLHLGVSLHGRRALHSLLRPEPEVEAVEVVDVLDAGSVYLTTASAFLHAPAYPRSSFAERTIAVMCRLVITDAEAILFDKYSNIDDFNFTLTSIAAVIAGGELLLPSASRLQECATDLMRSDEIDSSK